MGKPAGFIEFERVDPKYKLVEERLKNYKEFSEELPEEELRKQGARCIDCGVPYCHAIGCPIYNLIPEWNDLIYHGQWKKAFHRLDLTNNLPEVTGRICPAPCETSCTLAINTDAVTIHNNELAIIERAFAEGWVVPRPPQVETGKCVAVVGSGPAGLAAAQQLRRAGHTVVLFEKSDKIGGLLRYGIPDFKLEKKIIDRRLEQMKLEGIEFRTGVNVGEDITASELRKQFDAIVLTLGAGKPRDLAVPGRDLKGVYFALEFLTQSNQYVAGMKKQDEIIWCEKKNVLVIGGGDTGSDCVGTSNRQRAKKVFQFEILPKPLMWDKSYNPDWPDWPRYLRTSSSQEEGCERDWGITTKEFIGVDGVLKQAKCVRVTWNGNQMTEIPGSEFTLDVDLVLLAMGFVHVEYGRLVKDLDVALDQRGNIKTDDHYATSVPGVFAAGDAITGASLVVRAICHGREAAEACNKYLCRQK